VLRRDVFGIIRHPIYLEEFLLYAALTIFSISLAAAVVALMAAAFLHFISRHEEKLLLAQWSVAPRPFLTIRPVRAVEAQPRSPGSTLRPDSLP